MIVLWLFVMAFGAVMFFISMEESSGFFATLGSAIFILGLFFLISSCNRSEKKVVATLNQSEDAAASEENLTDSNTTTDSNGSVTVTQPASNTTDAKPADDSKWPRAFPGEADPGKKKWWEDWTKNLLNTETTTGCRDGVQIVVFGSADDDGNTKWAGGYVRVHQDGKPYACSESKDPAKEVSS